MGGWLSRKAVNLGEVAALLGLLILPRALPKSPLLAGLRGQSRIADELRNAQAQGYYESLIDTGPATPAAEAQARPVPPPGTRPFAESGILELDPSYLRWRLAPSRSVVWNGTTVATNRLGYRSPEVVIPKPPGTYRVVVIGSSNTMGHGVEAEQTYVHHLQEWLASVAGGRPVEVVNTAISGDGPSQQLLRMRADLQRLEPDWILKDASVLDFSLESLHLQWALRAGVPIPLAYVREAVAEAGLSADDDSDTFYRKLLGPLDNLLGGAYAGWAAEARRLGVPMTVVLLPRADSQAEAPEVHRLLLDLCRRNRLPFLDLTRSFAGLAPAEFRVSAWDQHPSPLGHRRIFEGLCRQLIAVGGPPGLAMAAPHSTGG